MGQRKLGDILLQAEVIDDFQLRAALGEQQRWGGRLGVTLIKLGFIEERDLVRALASQLGLPVAHLEGKRVEPEVLALVPADVAEKHMCLPLFVKDQRGQNTLFVGMDDPSNLEVLDELRFRVGMQVRPVLMGPSELCEALDRFYRDADANGLPVVEPPPAESVIAPQPAPEPAPESAVAREPERAIESPSAPPESDPVRQAPGEASTRVILRALTEILMERELLSEGELADRVQRLLGSGGGGSA